MSDVIVVGRQDISVVVEVPQLIAVGAGGGGGGGSSASISCTQGDIVIGRATAGAGTSEEIPCTAFGRSMIAGASAAAVIVTLGLGAVYAPLSHGHAWADITSGKPTTATGYGIASIDAVPVGASTASTGAFTTLTVAGDLTPTTDNTRDLGAAATRFRTAYVATSIVLLGPAGFVNGITLSTAATTAAPSIAVTGSDTNIDLALAAKGIGVVKVTKQTSGGRFDVFQVLTSTSRRCVQLGTEGNAERRGQLIIYGTDDGTNFERLRIYHSGDSNDSTAFLSEAAGTGTVRGFRFLAGTAGTTFQGGPLGATALGLDGGTGVKASIGFNETNVAVKGGIGFGAGASGSGLDMVFQTGGSGTTNFNGTERLRINGTTGVVSLAGATSSFPGLKRSSAVLQVRLADDSAYANLECAVLRIGNTVNSVSPTAPNRTVTIDIGGTTYFLHAKTTND